MKTRLKTHGKEILNIYVFGQEEMQTKECDLVQFKVISKWSNTESVCVTTTVVPTISQ